MSVSRRDSIWLVTAIIVIAVFAVVHFAGLLTGMDVLLLMAFFIIFYQIRINKDGFFKDYCSRESTMAINGIFIMLILFTHAYGYLEVTPDNMPLFYFFRVHCRQLVVTTFFFYSGYGIMESITKKGTAYVNSILLKRVLPLFLKFVIAVCVYGVIAIVFHQDITPRKFISALFTWGTVGNSNWYVTAILILYLIAFFAFRAYGQQSLTAAVLCTVAGTFLFLMILMHFRGSETYTYNTIFCFPAGIIFSYLRPRIESVVMKSRFAWWNTFIMSGMVFLLAYVICDNYGKHWNLFWYQMMSIFFAVTITVLSMKVKIRNRILLMLGGPMLFGIYILMRIPMNILSWSELSLSPSVFFVLSVIITLVIAWLFTKGTDRLFRLKSSC